MRQSHKTRQVLVLPLSKTAAHCFFIKVGILLPDASMILE
jgi:hypothetical protein